MLWEISILAAMQDIHFLLKWIRRQGLNLFWGIVYMKEGGSMLNQPVEYAYATLQRNKNDLKKHLHRLRKLNMADLGSSRKKKRVGDLEDRD
jgi:hypothetical protein